MKPKYRKTTYAAVIKAVEAYVEPCRTIYIARQGVLCIMKVSSWTYLM